MKTIERYFDRYEKGIICDCGGYMMQVVGS
jgi:hypothetical protein